MMSSANKGSFIFPFPICVFFISFSRLIAFARITSTMLKRSGEKENPCLVLDLNRKTSKLVFNK